MRLILVNPHTHNFGKSVSGVLFGRKDFLKYEYFIKYFIKNKARNVAFFIDGTRTSFNGVGLSWLFSWKFFALLEFFIWELLNKINPLTTKVYFSLQKLDPKDDILFDFSRSIVDIDDQKKLPEHRFSGIKLIHFTHYFKDVKKLSLYLRSIKNVIIVAEGNLAGNSFFCKYFPLVKSVYQLPYAFNDRFTVRKKYKKRINKCLALGSITNIKDSAFVEFFGDAGNLHPMRNILFRNAQQYRSEVDSIIRGFEDVVNTREIHREDSFLTKLGKQYLPYLLLEKIFPNPQVAYFKFDIVERYNAYKMFVCPEEAVGLPSINAFEGMACKNAFIGIDDPMYSGIGMVPGKNYIAYKEGDIEDLLSRIRYYQSHSGELEKIAEAGYAFVRAHLSGKKIAEIFWGDLEKISNAFRAHKKLNDVCSFKKI